MPTDHDTLVRLNELVGEFEQDAERWRYGFDDSAWTLYVWSPRAETVYRRGEAIPRAGWSLVSDQLEPWQVEHSLVAVKVERRGLRLAHHSPDGEDPYWHAETYQPETDAYVRGIIAPTAAEAVLGVLEQING